MYAGVVTVFYYSSNFSGITVATELGCNIIDVFLLTTVCNLLMLITVSVATLGTILFKLFALSSVYRNVGLPCNLLCASLCNYYGHDWFFVQEYLSFTR